MRNTKLILIEGLPGSGKSTTTVALRGILRGAGMDCRQYLEEDTPHPIDCLEFELAGLPAKVVPLWERLASGAAGEATITIIESRLWQNTAMYMYMGGYDPEVVRAFCRQVGDVLRPLQPVLLYLDQDNVQDAMLRLKAARGAQWIEEAIHTTSSYHWFQARQVNGLDGWMQFFSEWRLIAESLFQDWPGNKLKILNAQADWQSSYRQMCDFLGVKS